MAADCPRSWIDHAQGAVAHCPCPRSVHRFGISYGMSMSPVSPQPTTSRVRKLSMTLACPSTVHGITTNRHRTRTITGRGISANGQRKQSRLNVSAGAAAPSSGSSRMCPRLIQPLFARRSRNSRRVGRKNARSDAQMMQVMIPVRQNCSFRHAGTYLRIWAVMSARSSPVPRRGAALCTTPAPPICMNS